MKKVIFSMDDYFTHDLTNKIMFVGEEEEAAKFIADFAASHDFWFTGENEFSSCDGAGGYRIHMEDSFLDEEVGDLEVIYYYGEYY